MVFVSLVCVPGSYFRPLFTELHNNALCPRTLFNISIKTKYVQIDNTYV